MTQLRDKLGIPQIRSTKLSFLIFFLSVFDRLDRATSRALAASFSFKTFLPPELFRPILQFIRPSDFNYRLCLVSHSFRADVEAHFYRYIAVPEKRLLHFCRTMIARPDLARRVQRLAFTGAVDKEPEPGDTDTVAQMMKLLVNLTDLSISQSIHIRQPDKRPWPVDYDDVRILHDCPFKLERLACVFTWAEPLSKWLATQPQLASFEHGGYPGDNQVRLDTSDATLMGCSYLRISPYILACYERREKPQPVVLRYDMRFCDAQEELRAAQSLRDVSRNLKCLTLTRQTLTEYLSTSRILRAFADKAPNLTCLAIYENIDYVRISARNIHSHSCASVDQIAHVATDDIVSRREQADITSHQGALYETAGVRMGASQLPRSARRRRVHLILVGLLDRLVHGRRDVLV
jgi:hypothetical protein